MSKPKTMKFKIEIYKVELQFQTFRTAGMKDINKHFSIFFIF